MGSLLSFPKIELDEEYALRSAGEGAALGPHRRKRHPKWLCRAPLIDDAASPLLFQQDMRLVSRGQHSDVFLGRHFTTRRTYLLRRYAKRRIYDKKLHAKLQLKLDRAQRMNGLWGWIERPFLNVIQSAKHLFLVSQPLLGADLRCLMRSQSDGRIPENAAKFYGAEMLAAVYTLHRACGLLVLDLRPSNIGIDPSGHIRLLDLAAAVQTKWDDGAQRIAPVQRPDIPQADIITDLAPPELLQRPDPTAAVASTAALPGVPWLTGASDAWALGAALFTLVCGDPPFESTKHEAVETVVANILEGCRQRMPPDVSPEFRDLVIGLLRGEPSRRLDLEGIMRHPWFRGAPWKAVFRREVVPPFVPDITQQRAAETYFCPTEPHPAPKALDPQGTAALYADARTFKLKRVRECPTWEEPVEKIRRRKGEAKSGGAPLPAGAALARARAKALRPGQVKGFRDVGSEALTGEKGDGKGGKASSISKWWTIPEAEGQGPLPRCLILGIASAGPGGKSAGQVSFLPSGPRPPGARTQAEAGERRRSAKSRQQRRRESLERSALGKGAGGASRATRGGTEATMHGRRVPGMVGGALRGHGRDLQAEEEEHQLQLASRRIAVEGTRAAEEEAATGLTGGTVGLEEVSGRRSLSPRIGGSSSARQARARPRGSQQGTAGSGAETSRPSAREVLFGVPPGSARPQAGRKGGGQGRKGSSRPKARKSGARNT